jgi:hypothetical protein
VGLRPFVFVPRTLGRTWGTRPVSDSLMRGPTAKNMEVCGIPHLAKNERDTPNFLFVALDKAACAPFFKGKAHEVRGTHQASQEIGGMGHPVFGGRDKVWGSLEVVDLSVRWKG